MRNKKKGIEKAAFTGSNLEPTNQMILDDKIIANAA